MRKCITCGEEKVDEAFRPHQVWHGKQYRKKQCRQCEGVEVEEKYQLLDEINSLEDQITALQATLQAKRDRLAELVPPYAAGDYAYPAKGGTLIVDDVAFVFGEWHVKGHFTSYTLSSKKSGTYTYPVSALIREEKR